MHGGARIRRCAYACTESGCLPLHTRTGIREHLEALAPASVTLRVEKPPTVYAHAGPNHALVAAATTTAPRLFAVQADRACATRCPCSHILRPGQLTSNAHAKRMAAELRILARARIWRGPANLTHGDDELLLGRARAGITLGKAGSAPRLNLLHKGSHAVPLSTRAHCAEQVVAARSSRVLRYHVARVRGGLGLGRPEVYGCCCVLWVRE